MDPAPLLLYKDQDGIGHLIDSFACVRKCNSPWVLQEQNADFSKKEASAHPDRNSRIRDRVRAGRKIPPGPFRSRDREAARAPAINTVLASGRGGHSAQGAFGLEGHTLGLHCTRTPLLLHLQSRNYNYPPTNTRPGITRASIRAATHGVG